MMAGRGATVRAGVGAALLAGVVAQAQQSPPPVEAGKFAPAALEMRTAEWEGAARTHISGQFDGPAESVAHWSPDLTRVVVDRAIRQRAARRTPGEIADGRTVLATGLILHTDIALAERTRETGTTTGAFALTLLDARPLTARRFSIHWGLASRLAAALAKDPAEAPIARAWYRAIGALYQQWADLGQLGAHLAAGAELFPNEPVLLLYKGTLHQGYADARVQSYVTTFNGQLGMPNRSPRTLSIRPPATELGNAERALRQALAIDPSLVEAEIRLAHVLHARGKSTEAGALARQALAVPLGGFLEYYGPMVLGRIEDGLGHLTEAREAFARAAARYPDAQSAQVALSHVALLEGRAAEGVERAARALGSEAQASVDPWAWYFRLHEPDARRLLAELRTLAK
jgi:tetratricopeptide (TPR) repeat protein